MCPTCYAMTKVTYFVNGLSFLSSVLYLYPNMGFFFIMHSNKIYTPRGSLLYLDGICSVSLGNLHDELSTEGWISCGEVKRINHRCAAVKLIKIDTRAFSGTRGGILMVLAPRSGAPYQETQSTSHPAAASRFPRSHFAHKTPTNSL